MNTSPTRSFLIVTLATLIAFGSAATAHAGTAAKAPEATKHKLMPKVEFQVGGKLSPTQAKIQMTALVTFAGKTFSISVLDMGIAKAKKSVLVERKIGKLKVALKVSWSGDRTITIKGSARYLKFKVPVPALHIHL